MSNFLAVDTSSKYLTVLAVKDGKAHLSHLPDCAMRHSCVLMGEIDKTLKAAELTPDGCDFFAVVTGPGSFTGIRIGIAAAKGFAAGTGKPLLAVTSFDLIAYNVKDEKFYTVIDAAHGNYYVCGYAAGEVFSAPSFMSGEEVASLGYPLYGFEQLPLPNYLRVEVSNCLYPAVSANMNKLSDDVSALYVRKSQAEEGRQ